MIDEKKLIESFHASLNTGRESFSVELIIECIEEQPKVGEWIPCSERLPSKDEFEKAYLRNQYGAEFIVMIEGSTRPTTLYLTSDGLWVDDCRNVHEVIAWQPLPEPYREDQQ